MHTLRAALSVFFSLLRVLIAALFVFASMLATIGALEWLYEDHPPAWTLALPGIAMLACLFLAMFIFNRAGSRPTLHSISPAEQMTELDAAGQLLRQSFQASRAFAVAEFEDEGCHYFLELIDGSVLYLTGQYLYDYEPIDDEPGPTQPRSFPCTEFEILRHKDAGHVIHIECAGKVLEPECTADPFNRQDFRRGTPEDGEIITSRSYESLKRERLKPSSAL